MKLIGTLILLISISGITYFAAFYDTTVASPTGERVHNVGRMQNRQIGTIVSAVGSLGGIVLIGVGALKPKRQETKHHGLTMQEALQQREPDDPKRVGRMVEELKKNQIRH